MSALGIYDMPVHSFSAEISDFVPQGCPYEDAFLEAGCDDALIIVVDDKMSLDFDREANSYEEAVESATRDIEKTGARILRVRRSDSLWNPSSNTLCGVLNGATVESGWTISIATTQEFLGHPANRFTN